MFSRPWRIIPGTGQTVSLTTATAAAFTNAVGAQTYAVAVRFAPAATPYVGLITISKAGTAATASKDYPMSSNDPTTVFACGPGDTISCYQASGGTVAAYLCELTR